MQSTHSGTKMARTALENPAPSRVTNSHAEVGDSEKSRQNPQFATTLYHRIRLGRAFWSSGPASRDPGIIPR